MGLPLMVKEALPPELREVITILGSRSQHVIHQ